MNVYRRSPGSALPLGRSRPDYRQVRPLSSEPTARLEPAQGVLERPMRRMVALSDIKPDRPIAATTAGRDSPNTYTDWRRVIERKDMRRVYVTTLPCLHAEMAVWR